MILSRKSISIITLLSVLFFVISCGDKNKKAVEVPAEEPVAEAVVEVPAEEPVVETQVVEVEKPAAPVVEKAAPVPEVVIPKVSIQFENEDAGSVAEVVKSSIESLGFTAEDNNPKSPYKAIVKVTLTEQKTADGSTTKCKYNMQFSVVDSNGATGSSAAFDGKESHKDFPSAKAKAVSTIKKKFKTEFDTRLNAEIKAFVK